ncbi:uncharacterized protein LOC114365045 [Ostrinia furnacalis]|uniref:uncharacterized protein LOC114365045 n=1 Tax=Ostrinia furnacalis TaxID=93504 RepID=UPI00103BFD06|nr:uncharacterized protein LOC114365045 [Ostrinia furnacalis]
MDMPEVRRCFGIFPPKHGTYLISLFGLASGGVGIAGIILYGIAEETILVHFMKKDQLNEDIKKVVLLTIGLTSLMLLVANAMLFIGVSSKSAGAVSAGVITIFILCILLIIAAIAAPMSCFFIDSTCLVKKVSSIVITIFIVGLTLFLELWLYFMAVAWNHEQELG